MAFVKLLIVMPLGSFKTSFLSEGEPIRQFLCELVASSNNVAQFNDILLPVMERLPAPDTIEDIQARLAQAYQELATIDEKIRFLRVSSEALRRTCLN